MAIFLVVSIRRRELVVLVQQPGRTPLRVLIGGSEAEVGRDCADLVLTVAATLAALPTGTGCLTVVRSDIAHAARREAELGPDRWRAVLETHNATVARQAARHGASQLASHNDLFLHAFATAGQAVSFTVELQRALQALAMSRPADTVRARAGAHAGELFVDDYGDLLNDYLAIASGVADAAHGGEILVTEIVHELLAPCGDFRFGPPRTVALEGRARAHSVRPVLWEPRPADTQPNQQPN